MANDLRSGSSDGAGSMVLDPQAVTETFLNLLAAGELAQAVELLADDVVYTNVGLPTLHGSKRVAKAFQSLERPNAGFEVYFHSISADGPVVLTERTDVIIWGRFRLQVWVVGRFDVHDGRITLWRDYFDFVDMARGAVRALLGIVLPVLRPKAPKLTDSPGR